MILQHAVSSSSIKVSSLVIDSCINDKELLMHQQHEKKVFFPRYLAHNHVCEASKLCSRVLRPAYGCGSQLVSGLGWPK